MDAMDLLDIIGTARDIYVWDAEQIRCGNEAPHTKTFRTRQAILIAAIIALTLLLVGCAVVYVLSLQDMKIGEYTAIEPEHYGPNWEIIEAKEKKVEVLSVQGFADSPNQKAVQEYRDYLESIYGKSVSDHEKSQKMLEITQKYGLKLLSDGIYVDSDRSQILLDALKLSSISTEQAYAKIHYRSGDFHPEGTFHLYVDIEPDGKTFNWPYYIFADFQYYQKGYFKYFFASVVDLENFQEWEYTVADGGTALLALGEEDALILAERENGYFCITLDSKMGIDHMTKEMMEMIADMFDFSINPHRLSPEETKAVQKKLDEMDEKEYQEQLQRQAQYEESLKKVGYTDWVKEIIQKYNNEEIKEMGYAFYDIDGNGLDDLLIGRDGYCTEIFWEVDGKTEKRSLDGAIYYICEDQIISYVLMPGSTNYFFTRLDNGTTQGIANINYVPGHPEGEYRKYSMEIWNQYENITKEEFDSIMNSFIRIPIDFLPLSQYPLDENISPKERDELLYAERYASYEEKIRIRLTDMEERWSRWAYDICDLNDDGVEELIWREDDRQWVYTMHNGKVCYYHTVSDGSITVCEDGVIKAIHHYGPTNKTYRWYLLKANGSVLIEYLRYDVDLNPENPWFRSPDLTGQDITLKPISEKEAVSIITSYEPLKTDMKPIAEYPFS